MSTNRQIVTAALRMLTVLDANETPAPEDADIGLTELNDLMANLSGEGIDLGWVRQDSLSSEFPLDEVAEAAIKPLLAIHLHTYYPSRGLPESLPMRAEQAKNRLMRDAVVDAMDESSVSHVPRGEGSAWMYDVFSDG